MKIKLHTNYSKGKLELKLLLSLFFIIGFACTIQSQTARVYLSLRTDYVRSNQGPCSEAGLEEYTFKVNTNIGNESCIQINSDAAAIDYGFGYYLGSSNYYNLDSFNCNYEAWEDDRGSRCTYDTNGSFTQNDDDCYASANINYSFRTKSYPCASWESYDTEFFSFGGAHGLALNYSWRYSSYYYNSLNFSIACGDIFYEYLWGGGVRSVTVYLTAGLPYEFETLAGADTYMNLYGSDGYTRVAYNDDGGAGSLSKITFTPAYSGNYFIEVTEYSSTNNNRDPLSSGASLKMSNRDVEPPTLNGTTDYSVVASSSAGRVVNYTIPNATDNCGTATVFRTAGLASGSVFPIGVSYVIHQAYDSSNNFSDLLTYTITVSPANDIANGAIPLTIGTMYAPVESNPSEVLLAFNELDGSCSGVGDVDDDVWYKFRTPSITSGIEFKITIQGNDTYDPAFQFFRYPQYNYSLACVNSTGAGESEVFSSSMLLSNTDYYVKVNHFGPGAANGSFSICVTATIPDCIAAPTAPAIASIVCEAATGTVLSWPAVTSATAYDVYLGTQLVSVNQTGTSYTTPAALGVGLHNWSIVPKNLYGTATICNNFTFSVAENQTYYADNDGDGFGHPLDEITSCTGAPQGYVSNNTDCDDGVAAINPAATEICWNNIDDNCNTIKSEGCIAIPVFVNNPVTISSFSTHLSAIPYTYPGATSLVYRFEVTNISVTPNQTVTFTQSGVFARFFTIPVAIRGFNTTYTIRASAVINGEEVPYVVPVITVISTGIPTIKLSPTSCGASLSRLNATISANSGFNASLYKFRIRLTSDTAQSPTCYYVESPSRFIGANSFVGLSLQYGTSYSVSVHYATASAGATATAVTSDYGDECIILTPSIPLIGLSSQSCGTTLNRFGATISANPAAYALQYQFRVRLTSDNGMPPTYYTTLPSASRYSSLMAAQGLVVASGTQYSVSVRYSISLNGAAPTFTEYGPECVIIVALPSARESAVSATGFSVVAYPNPFSEGFQLNIKTENASIVSIKTYDMIGRLIEVRSSKVNAIESISIGANYPSGVYNVIVSQEDDIRTVRVVKR